MGDGEFDVLTHAAMTYLECATYVDSSTAYGQTPIEHLKVWLLHGLSKVFSTPKWLSTKPALNCPSKNYLSNSRQFIVPCAPTE